ncbi:Transcription termination factor Rho [Pseudonocardia sp. Ae168_Ps1]|uniref:transcription termination factor Rho n=1 Tax=unclassified Pseudonocardia TaxID=2619320 RepID=UPI00094AD7A8|nr:MULTISPECIES: transcription termination factor Rho [unclassified Pseudonocardia]OLL73835.1 Transcription termination factor Rho [Pseudonocardia sp. Ae150A_Ps1]OLL79816.1 Transcription termination factor Rho [Pseudonocardia sp. Ae168_Ps1]OLL86051.1 Transcription termination factor Rho [Pseudonocardia sp. Ae263_Ps1]OLL93919.1 Transcription termination factor Rho [Pseudonocardia sp. Ae356_Ps1]
MSETDLAGTGTASNEAAPRRRGGLSGMVLAELRQLATELNVPDISGMRKGDLIAAIKERQGGAAAPARKSRSKAGSDGAETPQLPLGDTGADTTAPAANGSGGAAKPAATEEAPAPRTRRRGGQGGDDAPRDGGRDGQKDSGQKDAGQKDPGEKDQGRKVAGQRDAGQRDAQSDSGSDDGRDGGRGRNRNDGGNDRNKDSNNDRNNDSGRGGNDRNDNGRGGRNRNDDNDGGRNNRNRNRNDNNDDLDDDGDGRGRRGRRFRDRRRGRDRERTGGGGGNVDTEIRDDDVLLPVAGIVDILDNYAFVRTTGYLSGPTDVYVSMSMVRKNGLRRGDAITGAVRQPREGEQQRQKFNPLVRVDTINGRDPESARQRAEFTKLTPLYPNERLRLETDPTQLTTRVIDLVMPVGKGQRALIVSPPKAGKTTIMQNIANAITTNNPECHLMVVLVDERPEEVTDMQRSVKGEVIASTFDRPPSDHTTVAELSIERAKRLVEMGHDVVVLLDNITRLGRAYNLAAPASGRILSGGVDSTALYPPKRFLGAARNIEDGGSLTIFATALVETGSTMDTVIFEEFKGTGNAELKLDRKIADKRVFPAIDVGDSGTRKEELLMSPDEHAVMVKLRRVLSALDDQQAIDLVLDRLKKTKTNIEFLMQVAKNAPGKDED